MDPGLDRATFPHDPRLASLVGSVTAAGLLGLSIDDILVRIAETARASGLPVGRLHVAVTQLHPEFESFSRTWRLGYGLEQQDHEWGSRHSDDFRQSPLHPFLTETFPGVLETARSDKTDDLSPWVRYRLNRGEGCDRFPLLETLREEGLTDYILLASPFLEAGAKIAGDRLSQRGAVTSWCANAADGFSDTDIALLHALQASLGLAVRCAMQRMVGDVLLATYLGGHASRQVLQGLVRRGDVSRIEATVLLADLRGFTALSAHLPADEITQTLDSYLEAMAEPVAEQGGEVLKFLGDGLLAVFRQDGVAGAEAGYAAACEARRRVHAVNTRLEAKGAATLTLDQALHAGEVLYGNVGAARRLDFTVIGPAVNEASRMEHLCGREIDADLVLSDRVAAQLPTAGALMPLGAFSLRDIDGPRNLWRG